MKKVATIAVFAALWACANGAFASAYAPAVSKGAIEPGVWNSSLSNARAYIASHPGVPLIAVWSKIGCHNCENFDSLYLTIEPYVTWQKESGIVFVYVNSSTWSSTPTELDWISGPSNDGCTPYELSAAPFVRVYWYDKSGKKITDMRFSGLNSNLPGVATEKPQNLINKLEGLLPGWSPIPGYQGGEFVATNVVGACMEAEPSTTTLNIPLKRSATGEYKQMMLMTKASAGPAPAGATLPKSFEISWDANETEKVYKIPNFDVNYYADGVTYNLSVTNDAGEVVSSTIVRCVPTQANSSMNPYFIGEKTIDELTWGDWTMDLALASNKVANATGDACLIMYIGGELWCPWCKKGEDNFLSSEAFKTWTKTHQAMIAQIDCPKQHVSAPTLVSHEVNTSSIAANGIASGSGYLTRKMADLKVANEIFERNYNIVSNAYRRPESSAWRTGMGTFILMDKKGRIAGRLEWKRGDADESKRTPEQLEADIASNMMRLNELYTLMTESAEEDNQNWYTTKSEVPSIAKLTGNTLSAADRIDTFRIPANCVGQTQTYTVKAEESANLTLKVIQIPAGSGPIVQGEEKVLVTSGLKDAGAAAVSVTVDIPDANCYVVVEGDAKTTFLTDYQTSNPNSTLRAYTLDSDAVLKPKEVRATAESKPYSAKVWMELVKDATYRIEGLDTQSATCLAALEPVAGKNYFYTSKTNGTVELILAVKPSTYTGTVTYQKWVEGDVGFLTTSLTVSESVCDTDVGGGKPLQIAVSREGGLSGTVKVRVSLNAEKTTLLAEDDDHPRFAFKTTDLVWEEGVSTNQYVSLLVIDYNDIYYGEGNIVLDMEMLSEDGSVVRKDAGSYTLTVTEDDKQKPGRATVTGGLPYFSKAQTIYVREGDKAAFTVKRYDGSDGLVSVILSANRQGVTFSADNVRDIEDVDGKIHFYWAHHETAEKAVYVSGVKAGQTAKVTLTAYNKPGTPTKEQFKVLSSSNYVNVVGVAADAPMFAEVEPAAWQIDRYVATSKLFALAAAPKGKVTFVKLQGTLPAGLTASYDTEGNALKLAGAATCKAGSYTVVYQVKDGSVAGLTGKITIVVADPTDVKGQPAYANPSVEKSRTLSNLPAYQKNIEIDKRVLVGSVQVTIPPKGNLSAKFTGEETVSFSCKSWFEFMPDKTLVAKLTSNKGYQMEVSVAANGFVSIYITPPNQGEEETIIYAESDGVVWSSTNSAQDWKGYYTVALPVDRVVDEDQANTAPRGAGYLTLKMNSSSAWNKGTFTVAGMLPNGTTISRSVVLVDARYVDGSENVWDELPIFVKSSTDYISLPVAIMKDAAEKRDEASRSVKAACKLYSNGATPVWSHFERDAAAGADYLCVLDICGSVYDTKVPLNQCCEEQSYPTTQYLNFSVNELGKVSGYDPIGLSQKVTVTVGPEKLTADATQIKTEKMSFSFNRSTGVVSGTWKLPYDVAGVTKYVSANWKGVVVTGWGDCCQTGDVLPFVNGSYYFTEKRTYLNSAKRNVSITIKRGGDCEIQ